MRAAVFPWREGNRFELLIDGPQFFPRMLVAIARAQHQVELELYLVEAGTCAEAMVQALVQAAQRGVRVRCLFDDYGSLAFTPGPAPQPDRGRCRTALLQPAEMAPGLSQPVPRSSQAAAGGPGPGGGGRHRSHR